MYYHGVGTQKDHEEAFEWFKKAAEENIPQAVFHLGLCYQHGHGVRKNEDKSFQLFQMAAKAGLPVAQRQLDHYFQEEMAYQT